ncbi:MAG: hypothetical protein F6K22_13065 [Okeania sp. SIO2F4]|nr:hypothetical protein [Okeania sp. SIO2F4]NES03692.1 hypothetical protein [Okeania sp. SIO2F4]
MNLVANGIDTIDSLEEVQDNPGLILISTELNSSDAVVIKITDNGKEMI